MAPGRRAADGAVADEPPLDEPRQRAVHGQGSAGKRKGASAAPLRNAKQTDCLCFLALLLCWVGLSIIGMIVLGAIDSKKLPKGDPRRLVYGLDYLGQLCSVADDTRFDSDGLYDKFDVSGLKYAYYLPSGAVVCVDECPSKSDADVFICDYDVAEKLAADVAAGDANAYWVRGLAGVSSSKCNFQWSTTLFVNQCVFDETIDLATAVRTSSVRTLPSPVPTLMVDRAPSRAPTRAPTAAPDVAPTAAPQFEPTAPPSFESPVLCEQRLESDYCDHIVTETRGYCYSLFCPDCALPGACDVACGFCDTAAPTAALSQRGGSGKLQFYEKFAADVTVAYKEMLVFGFGVAAGLGLVYLGLLQVPCVLGLIVWALLVVVLLVLVAATVLCVQLAVRWQNESPSLHSSQEVKVSKIVAAVLGAVSLLYLLLLVAMRKRIVLAIKIIREAAKALSQMPMLLLQPIFQVAATLAFVVVWAIYATYLASAGDVRLATASYNGVDVQYKEFHYTRRQQYAALYMVFAFFWTVEFIASLGQLLIAVAVVQWYFNREKRKAILCTPCGFLALGCRVFCLHAGTAAFGSLVIAVVRTIRAIVAYVQRMSISKNKIAQVVLAVVQCCLACVEKCLRFLNKIAYVQTAIHGVGLCAAGKKAFDMLAKNGLRVATVSVVSTFVLTLGKVAVCASAALLFYLYAEQQLSDDLYSLVLPTALVGVMAFATAGAFNDVFDMVIISVLQCFATDEELFAEDPYASKSLRGAIEGIHAARHDAKPSMYWCCCAPSAASRSLRGRFDEFDQDASG
ncbi:plasma-membrane choline transporter-domain-containing protein, partial [Pelagophyceae sp. CCMP2097]